MAPTKSPKTAISVVSYNERSERFVFNEDIDRQKAFVWSRYLKKQILDSNGHATELLLPSDMDVDATKIVLNFIDGQDLNNPAEYTYNNLQCANPGVKIPNNFKAMVTFHATASRLDMPGHLKGTSLHDFLAEYLQTNKLDLEELEHCLNTLDGIDEKLYWRAWDQTVYFHVRDSALRKNWGESCRLSYLVSWAEKRGWGEQIHAKIEKIENAYKAKKQAKVKGMQARGKAKEEREKAKLEVNDSNFPGLPPK